jgi:succinate dehydrogenase / fumarate reductase cytochrome b subunit
VNHHLAEPAVMAFYVLGTVAACYHFGNGLFGFAIHWGLATGRGAQRNMARLGVAVFVALSLVGVAALFGFRGLRLDFLQKPHGAEHSTVVMRAGNPR